MVSMYVSEFQRMNKNEKVTLHITPDEVYNIEAGMFKYLNLGRHDQVTSLFVDDDRLHLILYDEAEQTEEADGE